MKEKEKFEFVAKVTLETPAPETSSVIHDGPTYQSLPATLQEQQPSQA